MRLRIQVSHLAVQIIRMLMEMQKQKEVKRRKELAAEDIY